MAIAKVADRGSLANNAAASDHLVDLPAGASIAVGSYLIARLAVDNSGGGGAARTLTITDPRGNTWTQASQNFDPGAASAGTTAFLAYTKVTSGYSNGDDITFGFGGTAVAAIIVEEWSGIHVTTPVRVAAAGTTGTGSPSCAFTNGTYQANDLLYCHAAVEGPNADSYTEDSDTSSGSWVSLTRLGSTNATADTNQKAVGAYKRPTANTFTQNWDPTITSRDWAAIRIAFAEAVASTVNGTAVGSFGGLTSTVVGKRTVGGVLAASLGALTATVIGRRTVRATAASSLGALTATAAGVVPIVGAGAATLGGLTATVAGTRTVPAAAAGAFGGLTAAATATRTVTSAVAGTFGGLTGTATGFRAVSATATGAFGGLTATAAGRRTMFAVGAASLGSLTATAVGTRHITAAALADLGALTATAAGTVTPGGGGPATVSGVGAADLGALSATASATRSVRGVAAGSFGGLTATGVGVRTVAASAASTFGGLTAAVVVLGEPRDIDPAPGAATADLGVGMATVDLAVSAAGSAAHTIGPLTSDWRVSAGET